MPRSPTNRENKKATRKAMGKAPAARRRAPPAPWRRTDPLINGRRPPKRLNWFHRVAIVLYGVHVSEPDTRRVPIQRITTSVRAHLALEGTDSSDERRRKRQLASVRDALSSFEAKDLIEWHGLREDNEPEEEVEMSPALKSLFGELDVLVRVGIPELVTNFSLNLEQLRTLARWFRGIAKEDRIINQTKHDLRKGKAAWKKIAQGDPVAEPAEGIDVPVDPSRNSVDPQNANAVAGPSHQPHTPARSRTLNSAEAYPTPESPFRKKPTSHIRDAHAQAGGARIAALSLPTPAGTDGDGESDNDDFQDASEEMDVDLDDAPLTTRERGFLEQISQLTERVKYLEENNDTLTNKVAVLEGNLEIVIARLAEKRALICQKLKELKVLRAVEAAKWKFMGFALKIRNAGMDRVKQELIDTKAEATRYRVEVGLLQEKLKNTTAEQEIQEQQLADANKELRSARDRVNMTKDFYAAFMATTG